MIEKFLTRFCAPEVRTMIARMHERPDDFIYNSRWRDLVEAKDGFTWVERKVIKKEWAEYRKAQKRREVLGLITKEVIDPTPTDKWGATIVEQYKQQYKQHLQQHQNIASQYNDPRAMYGNYK